MSEKTTSARLVDEFNEAITELITARANSSRLSREYNDALKAESDAKSKAERTYRARLILDGMAFDGTAMSDAQVSKQLDRAIQKERNNG